MASSKRKVPVRRTPASTSVLTPPASPAADATTTVAEGRVRAVIDAVSPQVDLGRFAAKRIAGERVDIEAHCFTDGHDKLKVVLRWNLLGSANVGHETEMHALPNDVWCAKFTPPQPGRYQCTVLAWVDHFESWRREFERREDKSDILLALQAGAAIIEDGITRAAADDAAVLKDWSSQLIAMSRNSADIAALKAMALDPERAVMLARHSDRSLAARMTVELIVDRKRAAFSSWYEMFPRSAALKPAAHGTFKDVEKRLPHVAQMGFDVLYLPPIHPIGRINRKGANNSLTSKSGDVGSPWAIGAAEGGHKDILHQLGSFEDFDSLLKAARAFDMEIAMDIAFQCSPDHPYVKEHPQWFKHRPDGTIQYAENPPKKYQDIYPFDFETSDWRALWNELKSIVDSWIGRGVRIFRVDNPHTKAFGFWEWLINATKREHPDIIFLAEAFTRPKVMHRLAKLGFSQSYTYFTWRNSKHELTEYFTELHSDPGRQYFRPNVWPNTPDILPEHLQSGRRATYASRLVLAATLSGNYGIYGPAFELMESAPREAGSEEYLDSEKYQLRHWALQQPDNLVSLISRVNHIRRDNPALQSSFTVRFCKIENDQLIAYLKIDDASGNAVLTVVNLDPHHAQSGWVELDLGALQLEHEQPFQVHDLLSDQRYIWRGQYNYVLLDPQRAPAHIFRVRRRVRSERDFDYYL